MHIHGPNCATTFPMNSASTENTIKSHDLATAWPSFMGKMFGVSAVLFRNEPGQNPPDIRM